MAFSELTTSCPVHNQWIEGVWNLASAEVRLQQLDDLRHSFSKETYQTLIENEYRIFHSFAALASEARQLLSLEAFYN